MKLSFRLCFKIISQLFKHSLNIFQEITYQEYLFVNLKTYATNTHIICILITPLNNKKVNKRPT